MPIALQPAPESATHTRRGQPTAPMASTGAADNQHEQSVLQEFESEYQRAWGTEAGKFWLDRYSPGLAPYANLMAARNRRVVELCEPGRALLDVGSGYGDLVYLLRDKYQVLRGIEPSETAVRLATHNLAIRRVRSDFAFTQGVAERLAFDDCTFSTVLMLDVYEHVQPEYRPQALAEAYRVLQPGGRLIIATPSSARLRFWLIVDNLLTIRRQLAQRTRTGRPVSIFNYPERPCCEVFCGSMGLKQDLRRAGFRVSHFERVSFYPAPERGGLLGPYLEPKGAEHPFVRRCMRFVQFMEGVKFLNQKMLVVADKPGPASDRS